ncbi:unnamed protein product [Lupinus luteus]|uniref:Uncharacterized protein n=1 Tax=Lupinus luteus TaxID=3873 RepID=A0AAV1Y1L4_LUPLU
MLKEFCSNHRPDLLFISEPMILAAKVKPLFWSKLGLKLFICNDRDTLIPNIWGLCRSDLNPIVLASSSQQVSISLNFESKQVFVCVVYAHTQFARRRALWCDILNLIGNFSGSWCCIGDFNAVLGSNECRGAHLPNKTSSDEFRDFSDSAQLNHLVTRGAFYTWSNKRRGSALTEKRLDRVLCNDAWLGDWSQSTCFTLPRAMSDHHPLILCTSSSFVPSQISFKFHKMWLLNNSLRKLVQDTWITPVVGCPMYVLSKKLRNLKAALKVWNREVFGNLHLKVKNAMEKVENIQLRMSNLGQDQHLLDQENSARNDLSLALQIQEEFWREKARINWYTKGDRNTAYFHKLAKIRHASKSMSMLRHDTQILLGQGEIADHALSYFTALYASDNATQDNDLIQAVVPNLVSATQNSLLTKIPSAEEIKSAAFDMNGDGAPSLDGFGGCFFKEFWDISCHDDCNSVTQFFTQAWILPNLNSNLVVLISKFPGADRIEDFKPIALANFQFKIITKVLADRLASIAPSIISTQQRGFIKGRSIHDCICIASEAINLLDFKTHGGNLAIKLDVRKAFDTLDWKFLLNTLSAFGFDERFIHWVEVILKSAMLSISVNSQSIGYFHCKRRVRQGDPLSPLLFCLAEDVFSRGLMKLHEQGKIHLISGPRNIATPTHVLYADDILIFCKGVKREIRALNNLISSYGDASGQHINQTKCKFYSTSSNHRKIANLSSWLGFNAGSLPFTYLGVPLFRGKPKSIHLQPIADRIVLKMSKWKGSLLSIMGRVELVRTIIHSMLAYSFHIYYWPTSLLKYLDNSIRNFIWSGDTKVRKLVTVAWNKVCIPTKEGGLGLRSISDMNQAAILKLAWDFKSSDLEWTTLYKQRFFKHDRMRSTYVKSSIWPGIKRVWTEINENCIWIVGNGTTISYWFDNWLGTPLVETLHIPNHLHNSLWAKVFDFIQDQHWIIPNWLMQGFPDTFQSMIRVHVNHSDHKDQLAWVHTSDGHLTMKAAYNFYNPTQNPTNWCNEIWSMAIPPTKSFNTWRLINNRMPTDENLQKRGITLASICDLCHSNVDSSKHLFFECSFAISLWSWLSNIFGCNLLKTSVINILQSSMATWSKHLKHIISAAIVHTISMIWYCRNKMRFEDISYNFNQASSMVKRDTSFSDNLSKHTSANSMMEFLTLRTFNVHPNHGLAPQISEVIWLSPTQGWIKVNTDGAAKGAPGHAGGGAIFRDNKGHLLGCFATYYGIQSSLHVELLTAIIAVQIAKNKGWTHLWLETDSTTVLQIFTNNLQLPWRLRNIWYQCNETLRILNFRISHIFREGNYCADQLANYRVASKIDSWWNTIPSFLSNSFARNKLLLPSYRFNHA